MNSLRLRVTHVDMDGYWGRDHHPEKSDAGRVVVVHSMETLDEEMLFTGVFEGTEEKVQLLGHEVELMTEETR